MLHAAPLLTCSAVVLHTRWFPRTFPPHNTQWGYHDSSFPTNSNDSDSKCICTNSHFPIYITTNFRNHHNCTWNNKHFFTYTSTNFSSKPCGDKAAKCIALHRNFTCLCPYGFYFKNMDCHKGIIFPGLITLQESYDSSVELLNSMQYEEVFLSVTAFLQKEMLCSATSLASFSEFRNIFRNETSFGQTVIVEIQPLRKSRSVNTPMNITLMNIFAENSNVTSEKVASAINEAVKNSTEVTEYRATTYCAVFQCDLRTTDCREAMYPECICKSNYSKTAWDDRTCSDCNSDCSVTNNKFCAKENEIPTCKCLTNFETKDDRCVPCAVGYSGENCKNNSELILIIVGTVFGAIILSFVVAATVISIRSKHKKDPERKSLIQSAYLNSEDSGNTQTRMFPRVQTTSGHANPGYQPNNPYEMDNSHRSNILERDYDDEYEIAREPDGFRMQRRN
ncbi:mucin-13 [Rhea pennata]|uniref:mucin-13 n=1 Tax=Rhea pennata TaxID=8795 RepID=UPI002E273A4E